MSSVNDPLALDDVKRLLTTAKAEVVAEIGAYPPPIPACDQHFNALLERQAALLQAQRECLQFERTDNPSALRDFVMTLTCISDEERATLSLS